MSTYNIALISVVLMGVVYYWATTNAIEQSPDNKKNESLMIGNNDDNLNVSPKRYIYYLVIYF